jgi:site-specific DNA-cytosine methylase
VSHGDIEIAGTPCVDWSPRGKRGKDGGTAMKLYAAWAAMCLKQDIPIIVHENSHMMDPSVNEKVFGHKYLVESMKLEPQSFGWPTARPRRWTVMTHRVQVLEAYSTLANVVPLFYRVCQTTWHSYFVSSLTEKLEELQWACARKSSSAAAHDYVPSIHDVESSDSWS